MPTTKMIMIYLKTRNSNSITSTLERYIIPMRMWTLEVMRTNIDTIIMKMIGITLGNRLSAPYITSMRNMSKVMNIMSLDTGAKSTSIAMKAMKSTISTNLTTTGSNSTPTSYL